MSLYNKIRNTNINLFIHEQWVDQNIAASGTDTAYEIQVGGFENIRVYHNSDRVTDFTVYASLDGTTKNGSIASAVDAPAGPGSFVADVRGVPFVIIDAVNNDGLNPAIVDLTIGMG